MTDRIDPATARALDAFTVPALPADFADRLVARATATPALPALLPLAAPRRAGRSLWRRGGLILSGVAAFGLISAAAAATGVFGDRVRQTIRSAPVVGTIIASVAPETGKAAHMVKPAKAAATKQAVVAPAPPATEPVLAPMPVRDIQREIIAERIANRIERRTERREALGLPPRPIRPVAVAPRLRALPPEQRAAIVERVREIRASRAETGTAPVGRLPEDRAARREQIREAWQERNAAQEGVLPLPDPASDATPAAGAPVPDALRTPERAEQMRALRALRELRERRRELRRQRQQ